MSIFKACVSGKSKKATVMYSTKDAMMKTDHKSKEGKFKIRPNIVRPDYYIFISGLSFG